ncbi:DNA polymerase III subunit alpha [Vibrio crassostreae]|uniref:DNA polymerase III subunit alpha n=1 Tax=Vibrio crassostreae TaxID=246167 RepID=UPI001B31686A|nr:DNA polymerase III subunit alpha [Vibrio crassostreae]
MNQGIAFIKTHHSFHEASGHTPKYIKAAQERNINRLVMIDRCSMADMVTFYDKCKQADIDPVMGSTLRIADDEHLKNTIKSKNKAVFDALEPMFVALNAKFGADITIESVTKFIENKFAGMIVKAGKEKKAEKRREKKLDAFNALLKEAGYPDKLIDAIKKSKKDGEIWAIDEKILKKLDEEESEAINDFASCFEKTKFYKDLDATQTYTPLTEDDYSDLIVFASNQQGFQGVKDLVSWAYVEGQDASLIEIKTKKRRVFSFPKTLTSRLKLKTEGLYCVVGTRNDFLGKAISLGDSDAIEWAINYYKELFEDRILVGVERSAIEEDCDVNTTVENEYNEKLLDVVEQYGLVAFAMNNALYVNKENYDVHDVKESILLDKANSDITRDKRFLHGHYLRDWSDIKNDFADLPVLVSNAEKIDSMIEQREGAARLKVEIELDKPVLPEFPIPKGFTPTTYMRKLAEEGVDEHLDVKFRKKFGLDSLDQMNDEQKATFKKTREVYQVRIDYEVGIIDDMGFPGYFLIVSDFIVWSKENGVPVGPGRGSGAGSIVAYGLKITDVDPIEHDLLFERFLNPERVSMPDFDVDFGAGYHPVTGEFNTRDSVIAYVAGKYNKPDAEFPSVAQIATHGLMAAKSATKAIAKTMGMSLRFAEDLTTEFPDKIEVKMKDCLEEPVIIERMDNEPTTKRLLDLTSQAEGLKKSSGVHAGGVVIAPASLTQFTPVQSDIRDQSKLIAQLDKGDVERGGLVKFDFLGLANLTTISHCLKHIENNTGEIINLNEIHMDDAETYKLLQDANTHGVFQVESRGMRDLLRRVHVENIEELSALLALFRPGPLQSGMVDNFINRKHGLEKVSYPDEKHQHELLKPILKPTYGIILYQEQVMQIAQALAGYTLGGADMLRRAMGKKKPEEMAKQRSIFEEGAINNGVDGELAMKIFDLVEKFAGYGFNKSHSMAYAYISFYTAWLKTHYPTEYMAALLSSQMDDMEQLKVTLEDCKKNNIEILPPDINKSDDTFKPEGNLKIRFGLGAIHGVGETKLTKILTERKDNGEFQNAYEMRKRCRSSFDAAVSENLSLAGALDSLETFFVIPDGALRKVECPMPVPTAIQYENELNQRRDDFQEYESRFDTVTGFGRQLRRIIESLVAHYSKKYEIDFSEDEDLQSKMKTLWGFFGNKLANPEGLTDEQQLYIKADFDALRREADQRGNGVNAFKAYRAELDKKKVEIQNLESKVEAAKSNDAEAKAQWEIDSKTLSIAMYDKRAYHMKEASMVASVKATELNKSIEELIYISAKPHHGDIKDGFEAFLTGRINKTLAQEGLTIDLLQESIVDAAVLLGFGSTEVSDEDFLEKALGVAQNHAQKLIKHATPAAQLTLSDDDCNEEGMSPKALKQGKESAGKRTAITGICNDVHELIISNQTCIKRIVESIIAKSTAALSDKERLKAEMARLSYYVTGHPLDVENLRARLKARGAYCDIGNLLPPDIDPVTEKPVKEMEYRTAGIITGLRKLKVKKEGKLFGREMAIVTLDDGTGAITATAFPDTYDEIKEHLFMGEPLCITGAVSLDEYAGDGSLRMEISLLEDNHSGKKLFEAKRRNFPSKYEKAQETANQLAKALKAPEKEESLIQKAA